MSIQIVITTYGQHYRTVALNRPKMILGRSSECDVPINDRNLSRQHIEIWQQQGQVYVRDLGSTNGTMLGTQPLVAQHYTLWSTTAPIVIGDYTIRLESIAESDETDPFILRDPEQTDIYQPVVPASYEPTHPAPISPPQSSYERPPQSIPVYGQGGAAALAYPLPQPKPAQAKGCMAFLDAFLKVSEHFAALKYMILFLRAPVKNTMLVVEHFEGIDVSARDVHRLCDVEPYKFLASGFGLYALLLTILNFLLPNTVGEFDDFTMSIAFAVMLMITTLSTYFVFKIGTGSKRKRDSYMVMTAIMSGVQLAAVPVLFVLLMLAFFASPILLVLAVLYFYIYLYYYYKLQKVFWQTGYVRAVILSLIAAVPAIAIWAVISLAATPTGIDSAYPSTGPDTQSMEIYSGGRLPATAMFGYNQCIGDFPTHAESYWDYQYWYDLAATGMRSIEFNVSSRADTVLVVQAPDGALYCNDDTNELDPAILLFAPMTGRYNIWIGNFSHYYETGQLSVTLTP